MSRAFRMTRSGRGRSTKNVRSIGVLPAVRKKRMEFFSRESRSTRAFWVCDSSISSMKKNTARRESYESRVRLFYITPSRLDFRMRFQSRRDSEKPNRLVVYSRTSYFDGPARGNPSRASRVLTPDRAARTPRDTLARVRSLARHAARAFVKRRTRLPRLVLRGS